MSILVDTSVWIRYLAGREPWRTRLDALLADESVVGHDFVAGELLMGNTGSRSDLLMAYERITHTSVISHAEVTAFVNMRSLGGHGIGWVDVHLLASAVVSNHKLWTADNALLACARDLGIAYE